MWSVYILKSNNTEWFYVGISKNPSSRLRTHNSGKVKSTKARRPYKIVLLEEFDDLKSARIREKYYKTGFGKKVWMKKINY
ncbi:MAG: GIY-YIG nuclease family protein, partial [Phycisphaerae bacterium]|jgi:putative endonuclease|nr:GIY-YIG nuclease family protein [Phycisphaerae bacterium]|tara:strand:- start:461 stop:703 length:243 start_codon:yes stop_codon:yes gene_type:complete